MALVLLVALVQLLNVVMECRHAKLMTTYFNSRSLSVVLFPPLHIGFQTCLLRADVGIELLVGSLFVNELISELKLTDAKTGKLNDRSTSVEFTPVHVVRQLHHHAETEHVGQGVALNIQ